MRSAMRKWVAALVLLASAVVLIAPARAQQLSIDDDLRKLDRGWVVGFSRWAAGCVAAATYTGGVTLWLGATSRFGSFIAFTHPDWQSIQGGSEYRMEVLTTGAGSDWKGNFIGFVRESEKGVITSGLKREFIEDFARASGFRLRLEGRQVANISLSGSRSALVDVIACYNTHKARADALASSSGGAGAAKGKQLVRKFGTGFFVSSDGLVMTNHHVVDGCTSYQLHRPGGLPETARLLATDQKNDLAILKTELKQDHVPAFRTRVRVGENVSVFGFPLPNMLSTTGNFTVGHLTATAGFKDDTTHYQISAPVQGGNSGGPLLDQNGNVIGVIVAGIKNETAQNANFAIKASIAMSFLESKGITANENTASKQLEPADIAELSKRFTVAIVCENR